MNVYSKNPENIRDNDSASYDDSARALLYTGSFSINPEKPQIPQIVRTPGYPLFIAGIYSVFGLRHTPVILIQIGISIGTLYLVYFLSRLLWAEKIALFSLGLFALDIVSLTWSQLLMTETLFTFFVCIVMISGVFLILRKVPFPYALILGAGLTSATFIRPIGYYLIFPVAGFFLILNKAGSFKNNKTPVIIALIALPFFILVGGWQARNFFKTGSWEFAQVQAINLFNYRAADIVARQNHISREAAVKKINESLQGQLAPEGFAGKIKIYQYYKKEGSAIIRKNPGLFIRSQITGFLNMMLSTGETHFLKYVGLKSRQERTGPEGDLLRLSFPNYFKKWVVQRPVDFMFFILSGSYLFILYVGCSYAAWRIFFIDKKQGCAHFFLAGILLYFLIVSAGPEAYARFRVPIMPILSLYGGYGLYYLGAFIGNGVKSRATRREKVGS